MFGLCLAVAGLVGVATARGSTMIEPPRAEPWLEVPYVPQSGVLCGGAALAMVLRYWGEPRVMAEDYAALAEPGAMGIRTGALIDQVEASGWSAQLLDGSDVLLDRELAQGRPLIVLIGASPGAFHYVVVVGRSNGKVIFHDPNFGPYRRRGEAEFDRAWSKSDRWTLLVLPPQTTPQLASPVTSRVTSRGTQPAADFAVPVSKAPLCGCDSLMERGLRLAQADDSTGAERAFRAAQALCPMSAAPLRERAGLRFRADDWSGASRLATRALFLDPSDDDSWRLLAASRFLAGEVDGALSAWNRIGEPRTDLTRIDGLERTRYAAVTRQLDLPPGRLLTSRAFRLARRRLAEMPAQSGFRLDLRPLSEGEAEVNVGLLERPLLVADRWSVTRLVARAALGHEASLDLASVTGNGELITASGRWGRERPRVALALAVPAATGRPGVWRVEGFWERQAYALRSGSAASDAVAGSTTREERRRTSLSFSDWFAPSLRLELGAAMDQWSDRGAHVSIDGGVETRWARDRLALRILAARWKSLNGGASFATGGASVLFRSCGLENVGGWQGDLALSTATIAAPLALWSCAGTGDGRAPFLRAHPLLRDGIIAGHSFGRTLLHGTIGRQAWSWTLGPLALRWALFTDAARPWSVGGARWQVDAGTGLRLRAPGSRGELRIDAAHGARDGRSALSVGWQLE